MTDPTPPAVLEIEPAVATAIVDHHGLVVEAFRLYRDELYSFLYRSTRDEAAAEDLLQETFLRLMREIDSGRTPDHLRGWLYKVASNLAISRGRRRATVVEWLRRHGRDEATKVTESPEAGLLGRERATTLDAALATLSADARSALLLSAQGFSGEEIAATIGRSEAATRTLLSRARVRVRLVLQDEAGFR
jgi:RNA polymerase sigma-70 factor (ECF subfamily)/transmembrane sensor